MFSAALSSSPKTLPPLAPLRKPDRSSACHDRGFNRLPTIPALMAIFFNSPSKKNSSYKGKKKKVHRTTVSATKFRARISTEMRL